MTGRQASQSPLGKQAAGRIVTIPPGVPFLRTLARCLVDGSLVAGFDPRENPLLLTAATVYLPTRRAARAFAGEVVEAMGGKAVLLPSILTLGDDPDDSIGFARQSDALTPDEAVIPEARRRAILARLVRGWTSQIAESTRELFGDEDIVIPSSLSEAIRMAGELGRLLDQFEIEEANKTTLTQLRPADDLFGDSQRWAEWWQLTLQFLAIITEHWPAFLQEEGLTDAAKARRLALDARAEHYLQNGSDGPVIAAGTTGSVPATARLVSAIAKLPQGAVVLPGAEQDISDKLFERLAATERAGSQIGLSTYAQFSLARLLRQLGVLPRDIPALDEPGAAAKGRTKAISKALLPAEDTARWATDEKPDAAIFDDVCLIEAPTEREEALAISIALRETMETPEAIAALVTPDRKLARRVASELYRFGIEIDDSAGIPLAQSDAGLLVRQLTAATIGPADPVNLTAIAKRIGRSCAEGQQAISPGDYFELAVLRGAIMTPLPGEYAGAVGHARRKLAGDRHAPVALKQLGDEAWQDVLSLAAKIDTALGPLANLREANDPQPLADCFKRLGECLDLLFDDDDDAFADLAGGAQIRDMIAEHAALHDVGLELAASEFPDALEALMEPETVRSTARTHPRLHIWGPLEARLQHADMIVLGGLNEGTWPVQGRNDAFLNRPMRSEIGLSIPEWRIGQAAHDVQQLSGHARVVYSRSLRSENAPTVASRWLQRLEVTLGEETFKAIKARGARYLRLAGAIDESSARLPKATRPAPCPPLELRPDRLSVTEIETWIRDPYAIHAKHVLQLEPLPPLLREADALLKGQIYHEIAERFVADEGNGPLDEVAFEQVARAIFEREELPAQIAALWLPRVLAVGKPFAEWEARRRKAVSASMLEAGGVVEVGDTGFAVSGRADRIDRRNDGFVDIIDYKTSASPSTRQARTLSPQLALEAMMARRGGFGQEAVGEIGRLLYVRLRPGDKFRVDDVTAGSATTAAELAKAAWQQLEQLVEAFQAPGQPYISRRAPFAESETGGTYDHLARVREWSIGELDGEGGD